VKNYRVRDGVSQPVSWFFPNRQLIRCFSDIRFSSRSDAWGWSNTYASDGNVMRVAWRAKFSGTNAEVVAVVRVMTLASATDGSLARRNA
jgi:hypothetical protein